MITQENIPYTADEIKAMVKTIEELRKKYNGALERAKRMMSQKEIEYLFPELKESEDEKIKREIRNFIWEYPNKLPERDKWLAWFEKQNPAWSEKDKNLLNRLIGVLDGTNEEDYHEGWEEKFLPWLKSLKERMQPQPKQSEHLENYDDDERIRQGIIRNLQYLMDRSEGFVKEDLQERIAWLESQAEQPTDEIEPNPAWSEEDEEMLKWLCRIIHTQRLDRAITLKEESELGKWMDKWLNHNPHTKQSKHLENYDDEQEKTGWSTITDEDMMKFFDPLPTIGIENDENERIRKEIVDFITSSNKYGTNERCEAWLAWLNKQVEPNPYSGVSFKYNGHIWGMCARDNGVEILFDGELKAFLSLEKSFIYPIYPKPDLAHKSAIEAIKDNVGNNNKVEPKFKEEDYIVPNNITPLEIWKVITIDDDGYYNIQPITNIINTEDDETYRVPGFIIEKDYHLWTIRDAQNGDVLAEDSCIFIIQKLGDNSTAAKTYCTLYDDGDFDDGSILYFDIDSTKPATKEQRELLFEKMKQAGYEWNADKKELTKQILKITPKFCVGQVITDDNGTWYKITNIKCLDDWYYELYDVGKATTHSELCSFIDEKFRENRFVNEIKKMIGD